MQKTLDNSKYNKNERFILSKRKNTCLACGGKLPNNHWSFCCYKCKDMYSSKTINFINGDGINKSMRLGNVFNSEFDNLPKLEDGDSLKITKAEFGTTEKNSYPYVIITDESRGQIFSTASAVVSILKRDDVKAILASGETLETKAKIQTFAKTGRKGLGLVL